MIYTRYIKRLIDIVLGLVGMPFLVIIVVFVAPAIFITDRGPIFYNAYRIGQNGKLFRMYKFRSMYIDAPDIRLEDGSTYNGEDDPRVTKIGRFLRKTSLDEFPQILNVLSGTMSVIGPRPDPPDWLDRYPEDVKVFLTMRPGITGYSQAYFRNLADGEQKMKNDVFYALNCSFWFDVRIFFNTIATVVLGKNTYKQIEGKQAAQNETANLRQ